MLGRSEYLKTSQTSRPRLVGLGHGLVSDTSDKPALGLKLVLGSLAGPCLRGLLVELGLKLVYGGLGSRTEGAGLWLGWA